MARCIGIVLLGGLFLSACEDPVTVSGQSPVASMPSFQLTPERHSPPPPVLATPSPEVRRVKGFLGITSDIDPEIAVGQTIRLAALTMLTRAGRDAQVAWRLDAGTSQRARIIEQAGATCTVEVSAPGAIRMVASTDDDEGQILIAGTAKPAPGTIEPFFAAAFDRLLTPLDGVFVVRSDVEWSRYWEAVKQHSGECGSVSKCSGSPPPVDWALESLVLLSATSTAGHAPALCSIDPSGVGRVIAVRPEVRDGRPFSNAETTHIRVYRVAKLPATTIVDYTCDEGIGCPKGGMQILPDPDPFGEVHGQVLAVGQGVELPTGLAGEPLRWSLGPRTAARARLDGNHLMPIAPGGLVLEVRAGDRVGYVLDAIQADPGLVRRIPTQYIIFGAHGFTTPSIASDEASWQFLWAKLWAPIEPDHTPSPVSTYPVPPMNPEPPSAPTISFDGRSILAVDIDIRSHQSAAPVVTFVEGGVIHVVAPDSRIPGRTDPFAPVSVRPGEPRQDPSMARGLRTMLYDLPRLPPDVVVLVEPFPEAAMVK